MFDTIIVGGTAGLSAALHLAFHSRNVLVIDRRTGQLFYTLTELWNIPGFVGSTGVQIQKSMKLEAERTGAKIVSGKGVKLSGRVGNFVLETEKGESYQAKTILLATGVARYHQPQTQQVSIAASSGNIAAVMIDQYLQKLEPRKLGHETNLSTGFHQEQLLTR